MDMGHIPHVVADLVVVGCLDDVLAGQLLLAGGFVVEAEVEVGVEEPGIELAGRWGPGLGGLQDIFRFQLAGIEIIDLAHRHPPVVADLEDRLARGGGSNRLRHTEIAPGGVLDIA